MKIEIMKRLLLLAGTTQLSACEGGAGDGMTAPEPEQPGSKDDDPQRPEEAVTYYVATTGSDAASGAIDDPFRTIGYALRRVKPGDTVEVRGGDYCEQIAPSVSGERTKPITLKGYDGETARIVGTGLATPVSSLCSPYPIWTRFLRRTGRRRSGTWRPSTVKCGRSSGN